MTTIVIIVSVRSKNPKILTLTEADVKLYIFVRSKFKNSKVVSKAVV